MFRSDRRPTDKQATNEPDETRPTWQQNAPTYDTGAQAATPAPQSPAPSRAISESDALARDIKDGVLNGFVGNGTVMAGEAVFKGMLRVEGKLTGHVTSEDGTLIVGTNGQVDADVAVSTATIHGTVNGDIIATKRIEMGRSAKVVGNIQTPALVIEQGAVFEGNCRMTPATAKATATASATASANTNANASHKDKTGKTDSPIITGKSDIAGVSDVSDVAS